MENGNSKLALFGISHKTCTINEREEIIIPRKQFPEALKKLMSFEGVESVVILSTCNRFEIYFLLQEGYKPFNIVGKFYYEEYGIDINYKRNIFYTLEGNKVTKHLFRVISGLESLVLGEYQIQSQVRDAYSMACEHKSVEKIMHKLFHAAFRVGKKVRSQTAFGTAKQSVSGASVKILTDTLNPDSTITIIGVNENTKIIAQALIKLGYQNLIFVNRTYYKAEMMAEQYGCRAALIGDLERVLSDSAGLYSCTGAQGYIVDSKLLNKLVAIEKCPRLIIDLAVPRDIDTSGLPPTIRCYNLGDLQSELDKQRSSMEKEVPYAEQIIKDEILLFKAWEDMQVNTILQPYAEKFEQLRQQIIEENKSSIADNELENMERISRQLVHRLQSTFVKILLKNEAG